MRRRAFAWTLAAATVPAFQLCVGAGWLCAVVGGLTATLVLLGAATALADRPLRDVIGTGHIRRAAAGILAAAVLGLALWSGRQSSRAFPETDGSALAAVLMLSLAWWSVRSGAEAPARCAAVLFRLLAPLYAVILVFSLPQLHPGWLRPSAAPHGVLRCCGCLLLPGAALLSDAGERRAVSAAGAASAWLAGLAAAVVSGIASPAAASEPMAFLTVSRSVSILGVMQRFEALISAAMLMSGFCLCALLLSAGRNLLTVLAGARNAGRLFDALLPLLLLGAWRNPPELLPLCGAAAICCGAILILPPPLASQKNLRKIQKNA